jgi:uncharacterized protein YdaU (DUF1376 family)
VSEKPDHQERHAHRDKIRRIDFSPDEFLVGVAGMRPIDISVFWVTCSLIYSSGGPIPRNDQRLFRIINARAVDIEGALDRLISTSKLHQDGDHIDQSRTRVEIESARRRIQSARENGRRGGRPSKQINDLENPTGNWSGNDDEKLSQTTNHHHKPSTSISENRSSNRKGFYIPQDWKPSPEDIDYAITSCGIQNWQETAERFLNHWQAESGPKARKRDWAAAWKNWCRMARDFQNQRANGSARHGKPSIVMATRTDETASFIDQGGRRESH